MICAKFGWVASPSASCEVDSWKCEKLKGGRTDRRTDDGKPAIRKLKTTCIKQETHVHSQNANIDKDDFIKHKVTDLTSLPITSTYFNHK